MNWENMNPMHLSLLMQLLQLQNQLINQPYKVDTAEFVPALAEFIGKIGAELEEQGN